MAFTQMWKFLAFSYIPKRRTPVLGPRHDGFSFRSELRSATSVKDTGVLQRSFEQSTAISPNEPTDVWSGVRRMLVPQFFADTPKPGHTRFGEAQILSLVFKGVHSQLLPSKRCAASTVSVSRILGQNSAQQSILRYPWGEHCRVCHVAHGNVEIRRCRVRARVRY